MKARKNHFQGVHTSVNAARRSACATIGLGFLLVSMLAAADGPVKVEKLDSPEKALLFEVTVPAKMDEVWRAFATKEGAQEWLWPDMSVELKEGGDWIVHYPGGKTGGGTIVSFEPMRSITMRAMAPEQFPEVRRERTTALFRFEAAESGTKVTLLQTGWKQGKDWDDAYAYLADGNAQLLKQLLYRFQKGPIDWDRALHSK
ncbi:MAG TPA: SRPBCC domain-containing protein [Bryobacteraceae bacterium]|nr:SRPBCC domain-containing protein [Bryobacteraceae bacterium]